MIIKIPHNDKNYIKSLPLGGEGGGPHFFMNKYDDIINLPHHVSKEHPQMSMYMRAAQFAPFAALTGHGSAIKETARKQQEQVELRSGYDEEIDAF